MAWTKKTDELIRRRWAEGLPASQIAAEIGGVTRNAVIGRLHRLGLNSRSTDRMPTFSKVAYKKIKIRNKTQVIQYSRMVIYALQEALSYDPMRHHNRPPPDLYLGDDAYLEEIRSLVAELRRLNDLLVRSTSREGVKEQVINGLTNHFEEFLKHYAGTLGKGAGYLTIGLVASLLYQAGVGRDVVEHLLSISKSPD